LANNSDLNLQNNVFDLGQTNGGILKYEMLPSHPSIDSDVKNITVQHLLDHTSGWNESIDPLSGGHFTVAKAAGVCSPPGRNKIASYMLGQKVNGPLQDVNGLPIPAKFSYLNAGYMLLGLIIEKKSFMSHLDYLQQTLITPDLWVPRTELIFGRSLRKYQNPREPRYDDDCVDYSSKNKVRSCFELQCNCYPGDDRLCCNPEDERPGCSPGDEWSGCDPGVNRLCCIGPCVCDPYGGRHQESFVGHGNLVASAAPLLKLLDRYKFHVSKNCGEHLTKPGQYNSDISGLLPGTRAIACQRTDGINIVVLFPNNNSARALKNRIEKIISDLENDPSFTWPDQAVDGFWVDFDSIPTGNFYGGHDDPFPSFGTALARVSDGTKLRIKAGSSSWTGVISKRLLLDAPYGKVVIGK
jgi:hypothetical protein